MPNVSGPYLVRDEQALIEPGVHSYNRYRRIEPVPPRTSPLRRFRFILLALGIAAIGYYGYAVTDEYVYQAYENWSFDQQIAGRSSVSFADYVREQTPFGFLVGEREEVQSKPVAHPPQTASVAVPHGAILGRVSVARLGISAIVREGVDAGTLSNAVGHVPTTALPGQPGNFSIAAHRDTLFRVLRNVRIGDQVVFQSTLGTYAYRVIGTQIVRPSDVSVLRADGGPRLLQQVSERPTRLLTMITCYPFNFIGSAPERFIVQAEAVDGMAPVVRSAAASQAVGTRGSARHLAVTPIVQQHQAQLRPKKRSIWHRLFKLG